MHIFMKDSVYIGKLVPVAKVVGLCLFTYICTYLINKQVLHMDNADLD